MARRIQSGNSFPERMEKHAEKAWHDLSFNHKTTLTMGLLVPLACKEVYPGEDVLLQTEIKMKFAAMYLPIMHQCYFTLDHYFVTNDQLWPRHTNTVGGWQDFIKQDPVTGTIEWPWITYDRADAVFTDGLLNYLGFNAPPGSGTLILSTVVGALPIAGYISIYDEYYRNDQIQTPIWAGDRLYPGDCTAIITAALPDLRVKRRNWPRDYYTSATPTPQLGENVLIPSFATDPETGLYVPQELMRLDGSAPGVQDLWSSAGSVMTDAGSVPIVIQLSSTIRDFRYAAQMTEYLERSLRAGDRYNDFVQRMFGYTPNPLYIDRPVWLGGYTGNVVISEVMSTAEAGAFTVGQYAGRADVRDSTPSFRYTCPDFGLVYTIVTVYPKASYYSGLERMWRRVTKLDYMWEQFQNIGDQPLRNKEVWFSWYDADIAWNDEIFGYLPMYADHKYSNDIVSGQMRTLWEGFHLGRKFTAASQVTLNSTFITCTPDIGRVFVVDAEAGEHECYIHAYNKIMINRRLAKNAIPQL